jgi:hypothetical protein
MHELVIADEGERHAEPASILLGDGQLENVRGPAGDEAPHVRPPPAAPDLDRHGLAGHAGVDEHAGGLADGDGGALHGEQAGQRERRVARLRDHELLGHLEGRSGRVFGLIVEPVGAGAERGQGEDGLAFGVVGHRATGHGRAFSPEAQHLPRRVLRIAAEAHLVPWSAVSGTGLGFSRGERLFRWQ